MIELTLIVYQIYGILTLESALSPLDFLFSSLVGLLSFLRGYRMPLLWFGCFKCLTFCLTNRVLSVYWHFSLSNFCIFKSYICYVYWFDPVSPPQKVKYQEKPPEDTDFEKYESLNNLREDEIDSDDPKQLVEKYPWKEGKGQGLPEFTNKILSVENVQKIVSVSTAYSAEKMYADHSVAPLVL